MVEITNEITWPNSWEWARTTWFQFPCGVTVIVEVQLDGGFPCSDPKWSRPAEIWGCRVGLSLSGSGWFGAVWSGRLCEQ